MMFYLSDSFPLYQIRQFIFFTLAITISLSTHAQWEDYVELVNDIRFYDHLKNERNIDSLIQEMEVKNAFKNSNIKPALQKCASAAGFDEKDLNLGSFLVNKKKYFRKLVELVVNDYSVASDTTKISACFRTIADCPAGLYGWPRIILNHCNSVITSGSAQTSSPVLPVTGSTAAPPPAYSVTVNTDEQKQYPPATTCFPHVFQPAPPSFTGVPASAPMPPEHHHPTNPAHYYQTSPAHYYQTCPSAPTNLKDQLTLNSSTEFDALPEVVDSCILYSLDEVLEKLSEGYDSFQSTVFLNSPDCLTIMFGFTAAELHHWQRTSSETLDPGAFYKSMLDKTRSLSGIHIGVNIKYRIYKKILSSLSTPLKKGVFMISVLKASQHYSCVGNTLAQSVQGWFGANHHDLKVTTEQGPADITQHPDMLALWKLVKPFENKNQLVSWLEPKLRESINKEPVEGHAAEVYLHTHRTALFSQTVFESEVPNITTLLDCFNAGKYQQQVKNQPYHVKIVETLAQSMLATSEECMQQQLSEIEQEFTPEAAVEMEDITPDSVPALKMMITAFSDEIQFGINMISLGKLHPDGKRLKDASTTSQQHHRRSDSTLDFSPQFHQALPIPHVQQFPPAASARSQSTRNRHQQQFQKPSDRSARAKFTENIAKRHAQTQIARSLSLNDVSQLVYLMPNLPASIRDKIEEGQAASRIALDIFEKMNQLEMMGQLETFLKEIGRTDLVTRFLSS